MLIYVEMIRWYFDICWYSSMMFWYMLTLFDDTLISFDIILWYFDMLGRCRISIMRLNIYIYIYMSILYCDILTYFVIIWRSFDICLYYLTICWYILTRLWVRPGPGPAGLGPGPGRQGPCATFFFGYDFLKNVVFLDKQFSFLTKINMFFKKNNILINRSSGISLNRSGTVSRLPGRSTCTYHTWDELRSPCDGRVMIIWMLPSGPGNPIPSQEFP